LDHSTGLAHFKKVNDRDFSLGVAVGDAAASATEVVVDLNVKPHWLIDLLRDPLMSVVVGTQAVGGLLPAQMRGGSLALNITATNEAQKVDALSVDGFGAAAKAIARFVLRLPNGGSGSASDFNFGLADDTHASNADTIANSIFFHLDGGSTNINAQSDDNTAHAVAATDTTIDFTAGVAVAHRVELWIDKRDPADVRFYVEGARVLPLVAFDVSAFTGTWKLLAHLEKASGTETADAIVDAAAVRILE
jgi:hypothetical protein